MSENTVFVGCGVILLNSKGQFLMMKRTSKHGQGTWGLTGGHMEFGETFETVAIREVSEELGIEIHNPHVLGVTNNFFPNENKHSVSIILIARLENQEPKNMEPHKCSELRWCDDWEHLPAPVFIPYNKYISLKQIREYFESK